MSGHSALEHTLVDILEVIKPLREDWAVRSRTIEEIKDVIASVESFRGATVEPFGSFVSNLFTRWGDLDISIVLANGSYITSAAKKRKRSLLGEFLKALRRKGEFRRIQFVPNARVPILKFESSRQNISCDVSIDNLEGHMKSNLLFWINQIDGRFRDMVLLVKEWAKAHNINNPKTGTLNSYSLSMLVIFHLQTCIPAILPPLREIYPRNVVEDLTGMRNVAEQRIKEICNANISRYVSDKRRAVNRSTLSEIFISFLAKFSDISSKAAGLGICTFTGQWQDITSTTRWLPKTYALFIEDPFEQPENTARAVNGKNLKRISEAFQTTYNKLVSANQNGTSLVRTLVRPEIWNFVSANQNGASHVGALVRPEKRNFDSGPHTRNLIYAPSNFQSTYQQNLAYSPSQGQQHLNARPVRPLNFLPEQRPQSHPHNSNSHHPVPNTRFERHPRNMAGQGLNGNMELQAFFSHIPNQGHEIHHLENAANRRQKARTDNYNFNKWKQESNPNAMAGHKPAHQYHGQSQHFWRPKSDGPGHLP